jgi:alpha-mannosidase
VEAEAPELPLVTGELQYHAVGCYSVMRPVKMAMRRAEHQLQQAEIAVEIDPRRDPEIGPRLNNAWQQVCFNQFHDTLGGSCIPSAYEQVMNQLGAAAAVADEIIQVSLRRRLTTLADDARQRIALFNASDLEFDGYMVLAPWTEEAWGECWQILDEAGAIVSYQLMGPEAAALYRHRLLLRVAIAPRQLKILFIERLAAKKMVTSHLTNMSPRVPMELTFGAAMISLGARPRLTLADGMVFEPVLELLEDFTDTWSHGVDRLGDRLAHITQWLDPMLLDDGPLMKSAVQRGLIGQSDVQAEWRVYADDPVVELLLRVHWHASHRILKLTLPLDSWLEGHSDGIPGGVLHRQSDGRESPIRGYTLLHFKERRAAAIICPDVFALDALGSRLRLTLLRSPLMAHHTAPVEGFPRAMYADQGIHEFRFQFAAGAEITLPWLERRAAMLQLPPVSADWTKGMTARSSW